MALHAQLSALRELILGTHQLPHNLGERVGYLQTAFPALTLNEIEDLAKMDPVRLGTYTTSIYSGERSMIMCAFPVSWALMKSQWKKVYGAELDGFELVRTLHQRFPWRSSVSVALFENFVSGIPVLWPDIIQAIAALPDVLTMELYSTQVRRSDAPNILSMNGLSLEALNSLRVEELLELSVMRPKSTRLLHSRFDIFSLLRYFRSHAETLPEQIEEQSVWGICARSSDNFCPWHNISKQLFSFLSDLKEGTTRPLEHMAEVIVQEQQVVKEQAQFAAKSQQALFVNFFSTLSSLINAGAIVVR